MCKEKKAKPHNDHITENSLTEGRPNKPVCVYAFVYTEMEKIKSFLKDGYIWRYKVARTG